MMKLITNENYFEDDEYMSVSQYKKLAKCEVDGLLPFGEPTDSMLVGSYVDAWVEGTLEEFKQAHPEIISTRGASKGELKSEFKKADEIINYIQKSKTFMQFLSGEKQTIMTGSIKGIPFKIKTDIYSPHIAINDLKVMKSITNNNGEYYDFISLWGYDIQMACYQEIVYQNTGEKLPCFICAVTKEDAINSAIIEVPQLVLDRALYKVESTINHYYDVKMKKVEPIGCGKCKACISSMTDTPIISMTDFIDFM